MKVICHFAFITCTLWAVCASAQPPKAPDPRLASVRKAFVVANDELEADRPVSICFAERLATMTPIEAVKTKADADVIFRIRAHVTNGDEPPPNPVRPTTTAQITAELPDGTVLWTDLYYHGSDVRPPGIECDLADDLLNSLRKAMKQARDGK